MIYSYKHQKQAVSITALFYINRRAVDIGHILPSGLIKEQTLELFDHMGTCKIYTHGVPFIARKILRNKCVTEKTVVTQIMEEVNVHTAHHAFLIPFFLSFPKPTLSNVSFIFPRASKDDFLKTHLTVVERWLSSAGGVTPAARTRTCTARVRVSSFTLPTPGTGFMCVARLHACDPSSDDRVRLITHGRTWLCCCRSSHGPRKPGSLQPNFQAAVNHISDPAFTTAPPPPSGCRLLKSFHWPPSLLSHAPLTPGWAPDGRHPLVSPCPHSIRMALSLWPFHEACALAHPLPNTPPSANSQDSSGHRQSFQCTPPTPSTLDLPGSQP